MARATPLGPEVDDHRARRSGGPPGRRSRSFTSLPFSSFRSGRSRLSTNAGRTIRSRARLEAHVHAAPGQARSTRSSSRSSSCWEREGTFEQLREQNRGGPKLVVHRRPGDGEQEARRAHGVGPDAEGRLPALQGAARLRPALPERLRLPGAVDRGRRGAPLGLNSKREIEEFGLEEFARRCREVVVQSSADADARLIRLGQWMDWGSDYFTFSDTNIEYIWRMLKVVHERGWLYMGHRSTEWCPRCGTSLSQHELTQSGVYQDRADPSLYVRFPLLDRPRRVARHLDDDAVDAAGERRRRRQSRRRVRAARERRVGRRRALPGRDVRRAQARRGARRLALRGPVRRARAGRRGGAPRDPVGRGLARRGHGHRPHRARLRRRGLRALEGARPGRADAGGRGRPLLRRLRLAARALDGRGGRPDHRRPRRARPAGRGGPLRARLPALLALRHAAHLPHLGRLVHLGRGAAAAAARRRTRMSSGRPRTWASAWTTG